MKILKKILLTAAVSSLALLSLGSHVAIAQEGPLNRQTKASISFNHENGALEFVEVTPEFNFAEQTVSGNAITTEKTDFNVSLSDSRSQDKRNG